MFVTRHWTTFDGSGTALDKQPMSDVFCVPPPEADNIRAGAVGMRSPSAPSSARNSASACMFTPASSPRGGFFGAKPAAASRRRAAPMSTSTVGCHAAAAPPTLSASGWCSGSTSAPKRARSWKFGDKRSASRRCSVASFPPAALNSSSTARLAATMRVLPNGWSARTAAARSSLDSSSALNCLCTSGCNCCNAVSMLARPRTTSARTAPRPEPASAEPCKAMRLSVVASATSSLCNKARTVKGSAGTPRKASEAQPARAATPTRAATVAATRGRVECTAGRGGCSMRASQSSS
mmetsp:Transcript_81056/g.235087  ORF Transcript_81056/g.235087 Transcript_81056/m.235087 type:complete len:294 (-) Transcript_81056:78-959(-)